MNGIKSIDNNITKTHKSLRHYTINSLEIKMNHIHKWEYNTVREFYTEYRYTGNVNQYYTAIYRCCSCGRVERLIKGKEWRYWGGELKSN